MPFLLDSTLPVQRTTATVLHLAAPLTRMRLLVRQSEVWLVLMATIIGGIAGVVQVAISDAAHGIQVLLFGLWPQERLSATASALLHPFAFCWPLAGAVVLVLIALAIRKTGRRMIDPVEANALHGGQMSLWDSLVIVLQTVASNGFGASVGLEAAYTQLGGAFGSKFGMILHARRSDVRLLVGCGAGAAIAAAFGAPLAGAFYAFELIIGTYTIVALGPVMASCIAAIFVADTLGHGHPIYHLEQVGFIGGSAFVALMGLAVLTAVSGIGIMVLVSSTERLFRMLKVPDLHRPLAGGILLALAVLFTPFALSSGHGALNQVLQSPPLDLKLLAFMIGAKVLASAISLGSGFRGGLFFASLLVGALIGQAYFLAMAGWLPDVLPGAQVASFVGMAGLAAAVVGGPLTMAFLALEMSGSLPLTITVLAAAVVSSLLIRQTFGYSFTTWRFHLRGESIRGAHDIGIIRSLTVGRMMRRDVRTVSDRMPVKEFRRNFPLGSVKQVVVVDMAEQYIGMAVVSDIFGLDDDKFDQPIGEFLRLAGSALTPEMNAKAAARMFETEASDVMAVVADQTSKRVIGMLSESYLLRRYAEELDKVRIDMTGLNRSGENTRERARGA